MYYLRCLFMASSAFVASEGSCEVSPSQLLIEKLLEVQNKLSISFAIAFGVVVFAFLAVPERPQELASVCEKHHSPIACQVW